MIVNRRFIVVLAICCLLYLLPETFASDAMLYFTGGVFGGSITQILKSASCSAETEFKLTYVIWGTMLLIAILGYVRAKFTLLKYFLLFVSGLLLYLVDFGLHSIISYDTEISDRVIIDSSTKTILFILVSVFIKSLVLSWIYFKGKGTSLAQTGQTRETCKQIGAWLS